MNNVIDYLSELYGKQIMPRFEKLDEECKELFEAVEQYNLDATVEHMDNIIDELADVNIIITHIAGLLNLSQQQLIDIAIDKIAGRESNPEYKRKHPHNNGGA